MLIGELLLLLLCVVNLWLCENRREIVCHLIRHQQSVLLVNPYPYPPTTNHNLNIHLSTYSIVSSIYTHAKKHSFIIYITTENNCVFLFIPYFGFGFFLCVSSQWLYIFEKNNFIQQKVFSYTEQQQRQKEELTLPKTSEFNFFKIYRRESPYIIYRQSSTTHTNNSSCAILPSDVFLFSRCQRACVYVNAIGVHSTIHESSFSSSSYCQSKPNQQSIYLPKQATTFVLFQKKNFLFFGLIL